MASGTMIHVRINEQVKKEATETLLSMGLSVSDAVRVFLLRVIAEKQMPFALKVPNAELIHNLKKTSDQWWKRVLNCLKDKLEGIVIPNR